MRIVFGIREARQDDAERMPRRRRNAVIGDEKKSGNPCSFGEVHGLIVKGSVAACQLLGNDGPGSGQGIASA